jgi:hypothetical protein
MTGFLDMAAVGSVLAAAAAYLVKRALSARQARACGSNACACEGPSRAAAVTFQPVWASTRSM